MASLILIFIEFFKIGLFAVGGGLATLPFLYDLVGKYEWMSIADITNMIAISESTPGPIGINMATYVGYLHSGVVGAITTPLGEVLPSLIIIIFVAKFLQKFRENRLFNDVFYALRPASVGMIVAAGVGVIRLAFFGESGFFWQGLVLALALFAAMKKFKLHPVVYIAASAIIGVIFKFQL